jgi:hypothetical protein
MPILLFFKAEQFGLFEKLVPIKGHVTPDGTAIAPHMAIRHVRAPQAKVHKPAQAPRPPEPDLFAAPAKVTKPKGPESLDLFAERPTPAANPGNYNAFKNGDVLIWTAKDKIGREYEARGRVTDQHGGNTVMAVVLETQGKGSVPQPGQSVRIFNAQAKLISRGDVSTDAPKTDTSPEPVQKPAEPEAEAPGPTAARPPRAMRTLETTRKSPSARSTSRIPTFWRMTTLPATWRRSWARPGITVPIGTWRTTRPRPRFWPSWAMTA